MKILIPLLSLLMVINCHAQVPAFPGAEGGGKFCTGGRGGKILFVDNLNNKGEGSLREAVEAEGPRTIIFRISGNIELEKPIYIKNGDLTIAGQTAPGEGICLKNFGIDVEADNVIIRYIRVRPGDKIPGAKDAISGIRNKNIIIDHCSFSWANDEVASFYENENFTMQWCIISESLHQSSHYKGNHGYGGIWGGLNASFHHNLICDHTSRNPRFHGSRYNNNPETEKTDFRNNVVYNWGSNSIYGGEEGYYNIVGNYFKPGPATSKDVRYRILNLTQEFFNSKYNKDTLRAGWFFIEDNIVEGYPGVSENNWNGGVQEKGLNESLIHQSRLNSPVKHTPIKTEDAETAYNKVLQHAGASFIRDAVDQRIVNEAENGKEKFGKSFKGGGNGIIDSPEDVGGWPELLSQQAPADADNDGMPDKWEIRNGLNFQKTDDNLYTLDENYTNIEVYINSILEK
jgi:hypothetical protein